MTDTLWARYQFLSSAQAFRLASSSTCAVVGSGELGDPFSPAHVPVSACGGTGRGVCGRSRFVVRVAVVGYSQVGLVQAQSACPGSAACIL